MTRQTDLGKKVIYQLYPKSFYDSNGDGIGDLRGVIQKIDYLKQLHIDQIWFNPFFISPQHDNGYDIADYYRIDPKFGTMADFREMVKVLKEAHIGVMLDMVLNHISTDHEWFQRALAGDAKYQKFFYLRPPKANGDLPNNWESKFGGPAWAPFGESGQYYLCLYDKTQADLDWHNPEVRQELEKVVRFWMQEGVEGLRFDVINVIGKDEQLVDSPRPRQLTVEKALYTDTPVVHQYLKELNQKTFGADDQIVTVGEMSSSTIENSIEYTNPAEHELDMVFTFHHLKVDYQNGNKWTDMPFDFQKLKHLLIDWQTKMDQGHGWNALFWNNHDQPWALSRFGDSGQYREKSAEMLAATMHLLRGTPYIYMGEEIGSINTPYQSIDDYNDVESINAYHQLIAEGRSPQAALHLVYLKSRDNSRVPLAWDDSPQAGFTTGTPWLQPKNQERINVKAELDHGEIFNFYQRLIQLRTNEPLISAGHFRAHLTDHPAVFAYERYLDHEGLLVFNNFYGDETEISVPSEFVRKRGQVLIDNYEADLAQLPVQIKLRPYESLAFKFSRS
ncbi:alpha,alpha-phosphotrehalase [Limosilactobacillus gastricus]|uniref:Alpha,alpha-phosphotrehalase n=1 Tax=Limosilactobacillus gastricus DSM 16045 TaxID=1423749 RepID=A0A0R1VCW2_9LACO|nr:alpha,alpha-phosphotrehalase [Limosilactobacillus gastricus]KRM01947.1 Alpha-glucosidase [Limosilactobacillus gastricus DSM 16045]QGF40331.1 alpha,alpha-phosphotrehalase [Limosilactobacillus gastricus]